MTARQYVAALLRRWYVFVAVLAVTSAAVALLPRDDAVYWGRAEVVFLSPPNARAPGNVLESVDESVIYFAAAVQRMVDAGNDVPTLASPSATLYGTGLRHGYSVQLYNSGGQWVSSFERPVLSVQAVGTSEAEAQATLSTMVARIEDVARREQVAAGANTANLITTEVTPGDVGVARLHGSPTRAALVVMLLGTALAAAAAVVVDDRLRRRRTSVLAVRVLGDRGRAAPAA